MKKLLFLYLGMLIPLIGLAQITPPSCISDTAYGSLHEIISVDVLANNYDAEGDSMALSQYDPINNHPYLLSDSILKVDLGASFFYGKSGWIEIIIWIKTFDAITGQSQTPPNWGRDTLRIFLSNPSYDYLDINSITARINACGDNFWNLNDKAEFFTDNDTLKTSIFNSNIQIGGKNSDSVYFSGKNNYYNLDSAQFWAGPISDNYDSNYDLKWDRTWKLSLAEIKYHQNHYSDANYSPPTDILEWPGNGNTSLGQSAQLAPYKDINNNGIYEPMQGDYPLIRGDQAIFFVFNDERGTNDINDNYNNLRVEVKAMAYAFNAPNDSVLWNTVFLHYDIKNRSQLNYDSTYIGLFTDLDLGFSLDDYIASDVENGAYFVYNGLAIDGSGLPNHYGQKPPAMAVQFLAGPQKDNDGIDNPSLDSNNQQLCDESLVGWGYGNGITDDERLGMSYFMVTGHVSSGYPPYFSPNNPLEHYNMLSGKFADGSSLLFGGNGHIASGATGPVCRYMFPGNSDPCNYGTGGITPYGPVLWTEETVSNQPYDRKGLASSGPFTFQSGESKQLDIAYVYARSDSMSIPELKRRLGSLRSDFLNDTSTFNLYTNINQKINKIEAKIYPNPTYDFINIELSEIPNSDVKISLYSMNQQLLKSEIYNNQKNRLKVSDLKPGFYIIHIQYNNTQHTHKLIKL